MISLRRLILAVGLLAAAIAPACAAQNTLVTPGSPLPMTSLASFLNNALLSTETFNSGASAPANGPGSASFAYQAWFNNASNPSLLEVTPDATHWAVIGSLNTSTFAWQPYSNGFALSLSGALTSSGTGSITLAFPNSTATFTFPGATATLAGLSATQTFSAPQTFNASDLICCGGSATAGLATVTSAGVISSEASATVPQGGTGLASLTANIIYKGNGTSAMAASSLHDDGTEVYTAENFGVGVTVPHSQASVNGPIEVASTSGGMLFNTYYNGSNFVYENTGPAGEMATPAGGFELFGAASGTGGTTATLTDFMTVPYSTMQTQLMVHEGWADLRMWGSLSPNLTTPSSSGVAAAVAAAYAAGWTHFFVPAGVKVDTSISDWTAHGFTAYTTPANFHFKGEDWNTSVISSGTSNTLTLGAYSSLQNMNTIDSTCVTLNLYGTSAPGSCPVGLFSINGDTPAISAGYPYTGLIFACGVTSSPPFGGTGQLDVPCSSFLQGSKGDGIFAEIFSTGNALNIFVGWNGSNPIAHSNGYDTGIEVSNGINDTSGAIHHGIDIQEFGTNASTGNGSIVIHRDANGAHLLDMTDAVASGAVDVSMVFTHKTAGDYFFLQQNTSTFSGDFITARGADGSGSFTGNFLEFLNNSAEILRVGAGLDSGATTKMWLGIADVTFTSDGRFISVNGYYDGGWKCASSSGNAEAFYQGGGGFTFYNASSTCSSVGGSLTMNSLASLTSSGLTVSGESSELGGANGSYTSPAVASTNLILYNNGTTNWSGIGSDTGGKMYFTTNANAWEFVTTSGSVEASISGAGALTVASCSGCTSDRRLKEDFKELSCKDIAAIDKLEPGSFRFRHVAQLPDRPGEHYGVIAQQAAAVLDDTPLSGLLRMDSPTDLTPDGTHLFDYQEMSVITLKAVQCMRQELHIH